MSEFNLEDASGVHAHRPEEISFEEGVAKMVESGYEPGQFAEKWDQWIARGDVVLIFQNADFGHPYLGHLITMPWDPADPLPKHAPDSPVIGLGWRYVCQYVVRKSS